MLCLLLLIIVNLKDPTVMTMVSQDSSPEASASSAMHQCTFSDMVVGPTSFKDYGCTRSWNGQSSNAPPSIQSLGEQIRRSMDLVQVSGPEDSQMFRHRHLMNLQTEKESDHQDFGSALGKGLSLSLHSHLPSDVLIPSFNYREENTLVDQFGPSYSTAKEEQRIQINSYASSSPLNLSGLVSSNELEPPLAIQNSRYLRPAQSLLEEVISVINAVEVEPEKQSKKDKPVRRILEDEIVGLGMCRKAGKHADDWRRNTLCSSECSSANNHDIQIKIPKLVTLLEEVNSRYEQYCHQMEEVVSSFEVVAGLESAKPYTSLALQAMSRHFCSLRTTIVEQICAARRHLSEDSPRKHGGLYQLGLFEQNARRKRASLQHQGMNPTQQAWRPLRGLPENAVAILRAWLFEHFLHPYPKDSEKLMLATQTGLTKIQVSNWFINARVRLWKPMIEEMYREDIEEGSVGRVHP